MKYTKHQLLKLLIKEYQRTMDRSIEDTELLGLYTKNQSAFLTYEFLKAEKIIDFGVDHESGSMYGLELCDKAILYFEYTHRDNFRFWLPTTLSIIATGASLLSIAISVFK